MTGNRGRYALVAVVSAVLGYGISTLPRAPLSLLPDPCEDEIASSTPLPGSPSTVLVVHRNCGATTDYSTIIGFDSNADGRIDPDDYFFMAKGRLDINVSVVSGPGIVVTHPTADVFRKASIWGHSSITYIER